MATKIQKLQVIVFWYQLTGITGKGPPLSCPPPLWFVALSSHDGWLHWDVRIPEFFPTSHPASYVCNHFPRILNLHLPKKLSDVRSIRARVRVIASLWWLRHNPVTSYSNWLMATKIQKLQVIVFWYQLTGITGKGPPLSCPPPLWFVALSSHDGWLHWDVRIPEFFPTSHPASYVCNHFPRILNLHLPKKLSDVRSIRARIRVIASLWWLRHNPVTEPF